MELLPSSVLSFILSYLVKSDLKSLILFYSTCNSIYDVAKKTLVQSPKNQYISIVDLITGQTGNEEEKIALKNLLTICAKITVYSFRKYDVTDKYEKEYILSKLNCKELHEVCISFKFIKDIQVLALDDLTLYWSKLIKLSPSTDSSINKLWTYTPDITIHYGLYNLYKKTKHNIKEFKKIILSQYQFWDTQLRNDLKSKLGTIKKNDKETFTVLNEKYDFTFVLAIVDPKVITTAFYLQRRLPLIFYS